MVIFDLDKTIKYWVESSAYDLARKCTEDFTQNKLKEMEEVYKWLTQKL